MAFPSTPIIDSCKRGNEGPPPSSSWTSSVDSDHGGMKIVSNQMAPDTATASALWNTVYGGNQEIYAKVAAFPTDSGAGSFEWWLNVINGDTATPSGYILRFWHSGTGGSGALELDRVDAGSLTRIDDMGVTLALGDVVGFGRYGSVITVYVNGVEQTGISSVSDTTYMGASKIGIGTLNDFSLLSRYTDIGGGTVGQYGYPDADVTTTGWTTTPLWSKIEEDPASDADFITATAV